MSDEANALWWYECDVLPVVGFVRAPDSESAQVAALDDAANRVRAYLADAHWELKPVLTSEELNGTRTDT